MSTTVWIALALALLVGCASGNCRTQREKEAQVSAQASAQKVWVYKQDGSLQCGMGEPVSLDVMQEQLDSITVFAAEKRNDGRMRTQVCGNATGDANVYLIDEADLEAAKAKGFDEWIF